MNDTFVSFATLLIMLAIVLTHSTVKPTGKVELATSSTKSACVNCRCGCGDSGVCDCEHK